MSNTNFMQIFQVYYNWLYSRSGSGYILDDNFEDLKDVQTCPPELTLFLLSNYLPDSLKFAIQVNGLITPQTIRNFYTMSNPDLLMEKEQIIQSSIFVILYWVLPLPKQKSWMVIS